MLPIKIQLPEGYLNEETRLDYVITTKMKQIWAVQLDLLAELDRVCKKYGLQYYADSGTLIGAVREQGYIPWDDDIDIVMKREDYDRLVSIGQSEFQSPYFFQNAYSDDFIRGFSRLRNSETTGIIYNDLRLRCNKGIFIDIFPLDNVPKQDISKTLWLKRIKCLSLFLYRSLTAIQRDYSSLPKKIGCGIIKGFYKLVDYKIIFRHYEQICKKYLGCDTEYISYIAYSHGKQKHIWKRNSFDFVEYRTFEFMEIPIPVGYDSRLKIEYGDYMTRQKAPATHGNVIFDPQKSYREYEDKYSEETLKTLILSSD